VFKTVRFSQAARKHRIGKAHVFYVMPPLRFDVAVVGRYIHAERRRQGDTHL